MKDAKDIVIRDLRQELIQAVHTLEAVNRSRTLLGAKKTVTKTLKKLGYL